MTKEQIRSALRDYILTNFLPGEQPETLEDSTPLITSGIITSLSLVEIVTFIEDKFDVMLDHEDIGAARMDSIDRLTDLVMERLRKAAAAP